MGNCQTKNSTAVADRQQAGPPPPCRSDSYSIDLGSNSNSNSNSYSNSYSSDASSVDDARLMVSKASDEEIDGVQEEEDRAIRANLEPLDAVQLAESFAANAFEASASTGIEFGFGLVSDGRVEGTENISKPTVDAKLTVVTTADPSSAVESTKPPKSSSRNTRTSSSSRHHHQSKHRGTRHVVGPGLPKASTSSVADRSHLLDELDGLVASFSMSIAGTSNEEEEDSDSGDEFDGLEQSVIGVVPLPGEESAAVEAKATHGKDIPKATCGGAIVPFDTDFSHFDDSHALVPFADAADNNASGTMESEKVEMQLALGSGQKVCAYEVTKDDIEAASKNNNMMVVHEPNSAGGVEVDPFGNQLTFQDEKENEDLAKDLHNMAIVPSTGVPPLLTPPNDANKSMPSELYLSPESSEEDEDDRLFTDDLPVIPLLMPEKYQAEATTELVPYPASSPTKTNEESFAEENPHAIVEFAGHSLVPAGYQFSKPTPPVPAKTSFSPKPKSSEPRDNSKESAGGVEIEVQLCGPTSPPSEENTAKTANNAGEEGNDAITSAEVQRPDSKETNAKEASKETISESVATTSAPSSALLPANIQSVASMSRLSRRAKHYRATAMNKAARTEPKKSVDGTGTAEVKRKDTVEEDVSIAETKSMDLSIGIVECNSGETEVSEITSNHVDLDEVSVTSRASHRARQLRSKSTVRRGRAMSVERRGGVVPDDKAIKDAVSSSNAKSAPILVKNALPPVPKAATSIASVLPSDGKKTEDRPSATTSSCRLAKTRRSRSRSVRRRAASPRRTSTTGTKKEEGTGGQKKEDLSPQSSSIDRKVAEDLETEESKKIEEKASDAESKDDPIVGGEKETNVEDNTVEKEESSARRPRTLSQRRAMAARLGKESCPRAILGEKDTAAAGNNSDREPSTKGRGPPAPEGAAGRSTKSLSERKARAARMKKAVDVSSVETSPSMDEAESVSNSSAENGENNAILDNVSTKVAASTDSKVEDKMQERKEKARRRTERARRLKALQN